MKPLFVLMLALEMTFVAHAQAEDLAERFARFHSPDGRFVLRAAGENGTVSGITIVEASKDRAVADLSKDVMLSEPQSVVIVWAKDSKSFAANFHAGGRYSTTSFYRWEKNAFVAMESPEAALHAKVVEPARKRELKSAGMPDKTYLRRIADNWETVKWIDASTVEIHGESLVSYPVNDDTVDIAIAVNATVKFGADGKPEILKSAEVPATD
jgi:hypothetical protein